MKAPNAAPLRLRLAIRGAVQGVGFRPFVYRLATDLALSGWVSNSAAGVVVEVEGDRDCLQDFFLRLEAEKPSQSFVQSVEASWLDALAYRGFEIRNSDSSGEKTALVTPDIATCSECLLEVFDPDNRRYLYPFTNCTHCGPRFSIVTALPYDRGNTSMRAFAMCAHCEREYRDPIDRRFHAQPNACPDCGPHLEFWESSGSKLYRHEALLEAAEAIRAGRIVAVKGLGGFHLITLASDDEAVRRLRRLKGREEKPLALMFPTLKSIENICAVPSLERQLLRSPEAPIVLLRRRCDLSTRGNRLPLCDAIAPGNPMLGAMLPYTPLHHLLLRELNVPVVATSGNLRDEPICIDEQEASERLDGIADGFLVHNRPIIRPIDDSVVRVLSGRELVLRRARGYAPLPVGLGTPSDRPILAVGAQLKNTVALATSGQALLSQHIGDLETAQAIDAFQRALSDLPRLYGAQPALMAADMHPDYFSSRFACANGIPVLRVQHHYAHVLACMAENELSAPVLGVCWDGTGYGLDGTIWGGEFLCVTTAGFERIAWLRPFPLPGGDRAAQEPRRAALGLLYELFGDEGFTRAKLPTLRAFKARELTVVAQMLRKSVNTIRTSSMGRLFDAVASLIGLRQRNHFEGQAAMELEFAAEDGQTDGSYEIQLRPVRNRARQQWPIPGKSAGRRSEEPAEEVADVSGELWEADWSSALQALLEDIERGVPAADMSMKFHHGLAELVVTVARRAGIQRVALSGGCFQNGWLAEQTIRRLRECEFLPYWHRRIPPNDGGIALGQVIAAVRERR